MKPDNPDNALAALARIRRQARTLVWLTAVLFALTFILFLKVMSL